jgi:6-phosphogluconolactonase
MSGKLEIRIAQAQHEWAKEAAVLVHELGTQAIHDHNRFFIALSGGTTPEHLYRTLASPPYAGHVGWSRTIFFFSDERCVPPDHPDSNFGLASRTLFAPLTIPPEHIHRMRGEVADPEAAALDYERQLRIIDSPTQKDSPHLDLLLLGLGQDGHTASLFPGTKAVSERQRLVAVGQAPTGITTRLTLTLGVINQASVVLFLIMGADKAKIVKRVLEPDTDADRQLPAALVKPQSGRLIWLLDGPAAALLTMNP